MVFELVSLALAALIGCVLGAIFFGGLWWTVSRGLASPIPALWFLGSMALRTAITLAGFALVSRGHWERMLACLVGFFIARIVVTRLTRGGAANRAAVVREEGYAT